MILSYGLKIKKFYYIIGCSYSKSKIYYNIIVYLFIQYNFYGYG